MKPLRLVAPLLLCAFSAPAAEPSAVQLCVKLPEGLQLFAKAPAPNYRALNADTWMLDFEVLLNGRRPTRLSRGTAECLRAWLPAEHVRDLTLDLSKLPLNPTSQSRHVDLKLTAGLLSEGGTIVVERRPWSTATSSMGGELVLERVTRTGPVVVSDALQLPAGKYVIKHVPDDSTKRTCAVTIDAVGSGTVRADRHEDVFAELLEHYRKEVLPSVIKKHKLRCQPGEVVRLSLRLVDGVFQSPLDPLLERVQEPTEAARYQLVVDGQARPFESGQSIEVGFGQQLVFSRVEQRASAE